MKKRFILLAAVMALLAVMQTGCAPGGGLATENQTAYEKIQEKLLGMKTYVTVATVEYKSNKSSNTYETRQYCKISGEYRIEITGPDAVAGNVTLSDGKTIYQFNPKISGRISKSADEQQERSEILLSNFIKNYVRSQAVSINVANMGESKCTVLEAAIPGEHPYIASEKLWIDNKTLKPVKLVIYDSDGAERIIVEYSIFEYDITLDDTLFTV